MRVPDYTERDMREFVNEKSEPALPAPITTEATVVSDVIEREWRG